MRPSSTHALTATQVYVCLINSVYTERFKSIDPDPTVSDVCSWQDETRVSQTVPVMNRLCPYWYMVNQTRNMIADSCDLVQVYNLENFAKKDDELYRLVL